MLCEGIIFFHFKNTVIPTYIEKKEDELHVYPVGAEKDATFYAEYAPQIIICGENIKDALDKFRDLPVILESPV